MPLVIADEIYIVEIVCISGTKIMSFMSLLIVSACSDLHLAMLAYHTDPQTTACARCSANSSMSSAIAGEAHAVGEAVRISSTTSRHTQEACNFFSAPWCSVWCRSVFHHGEARQPMRTVVGIQSDNFFSGAAL